MNTESNNDETVYKVAIIDDDSGAIEKLREMLAEYDNLEVTVTAGSFTAGVEMLESNPADLIFVDVALPDGDGQELASMLRSIPTTADSYMVMYTGFYDRCMSKDRVFHDGEEDYLLKPIDKDALDVCVRRFYFRRRKRSQSRAQTAVELPVEDNRVLVVMTSTTSEMRVIKVKDIGYFNYNSRRKVWEAVLTDNTIVQLKKSSTASDILAYSSCFLQTHQSYIVNLDYVMLIGRQHINLYPPFDKDEVLVGRTYLKSLQARFMCL